MGGSSRGTRPVYAGGGATYNNTLDTYYKHPPQDTDETKRVFISYSMRNKAQVELLRQQVKNDSYSIEFVDTSLKNPVKNRSWKSVVGRKIENSDVVLCMVGDDTHTRPAVSWELQVAYKNDIPVIPVRIHKDRKSRLPRPIVVNQDQAVNWNLEDIQYEVNYAG